MSLRKSPTLTPALLAANRRNAKKSTGPRTDRGKEWSRVNRLRHGMRSRRFVKFYDDLMAAMPGQVRRTAEAAMLPPYLARHPLYVGQVEDVIRTDLALCAEHAQQSLRLQTFQAGMSMKTNRGDRNWMEHMPAKAGKLDTATAPAGAAQLRKTTFQAGMLKKIKDADTANAGQPEIGNCAPLAGGFAPVQGKTTFQAGMSMKTQESSTNKVRTSNTYARQTRSAGLGLGSLETEPTFEEDVPIDPDEFTDEQIARVLEFPRKTGMNTRSFAWSARDTRTSRVGTPALQISICDITHAQNGLRDSMPTP